MGHTVTEKARRSEWQTSDRYLAFECNCMQQKHERKNDGVSRRCLGMYNGLTQRRDQWSRLHPQESESPESTPVGTGGGVRRGLGRGHQAANRATRKGKCCPRLWRGTCVQGQWLLLCVWNWKGQTGRCQDTCRGHGGGWPRGQKNTPIGHCFQSTLRWLPHLHTRDAS